MVSVFRKYNRQSLILFAACIVLFMAAGCNHVSLPQSYTKVDVYPHIYPDYVNVTVPVNIAPLRFEMDDACEEMVARMYCGEQEILCGGGSVQPDAEEWSRLLSGAAGKDVTVEVFAREKGEWKGFKPFVISVSADSIDPYISYRLISPSYVGYEDLTINQRCLENFEENVIYDNMLCSTANDGQCINCHHYQNYNPERMQFHARQNLGGTVISYDGNITKRNLRNDSILSAGVYPAWHPWLDLIVYSTNLTGQVFHTRDLNKIEVFDSGSDLIAYDIKRNEITNIQNEDDQLEVFPAWAPDGKTLYYCSAHIVYNDSTDRALQTIHQAKQLKYCLYKKSFDLDTWQFGPPQMVFNADSIDKSATLPRISPDGRFLMFTLGNYGCFHIWHRDADLWLMDLQSGVAQPLKTVNSDNTESYHSWSSNGRWLVFSSRRDDGGFTRPFIAHIDSEGKATKPFELPQQDPDRHRQMLWSYNIPEFMKGPVKTSPQTFAKVLRSESMQPAKYVGRLSK